MSIEINVTDKRAVVGGTPIIVCGNSDYKIEFVFDAEWNDYDSKIARFTYRRGGSWYFEDVEFEGTSVAVPMFLDIGEVLVGVYAGDLHTTTSARIVCKRSILCGTAKQAPLTPSQYDEIMELLSSQNATVYIGPDQPTDGTVYWLDTSEDEVNTGDNGGSEDTGGDEGETPETVTYTITNTLTNVTNSNAATSVEENTSYSATLTATDGYELGTVTVTMGGTDVTSTVYADGVVTISAVTGNVVITATATAASTESDVDLSETNVFVSSVVSSGSASLALGASTSPTWDDFMALDVEKLYFCFTPYDQYKKTIKLKASYNSGYGAEIIANNITVAQATNGTYDVITNAWDKYSESGYMVFEIDVAALQASVQALYDTGTLDSTKEKRIYIETVNQVSAGSTAYLLYNYNG